MDTQRFLVLALSVLLLSLGIMGLAACNHMASDLAQVSGHTDAIRKTADAVEVKAPIVKPEMETIKGHADNIDASVKASASETADKLKTLEKAVIAAQGDARKYKDLYEKEKASYLAQIKKYNALVIVASGLAIGVSLFLWAFGNLKSLTFTIAALTVFGTAVTLQVALAYLVYIAIGFGVLIAGVVGYYAWVHSRDPEPPKVDVPKA